MALNVQPVAQGSGVPGQQLNQGGAPADRKAAAKAAFLGTTLTESEPPVDPQIEREQRSVRKIKMRTNANVDRFAPPMEQTEQTTEPTETTENGIADANDAVTEETKPLSPQFAALARQKRANQVKELELKQREEALATKETTQGGYTKEQVLANPLSVLMESGVTYDDLTTAILASPGQGTSNQEIQALKAELQSLKEGIDKNFVDRDTHAEQQVLSEMRREADRLSSQGEGFAEIRDTKSQWRVTDLIHRTYKESGEVMDVTEAMEMIEKELRLDAEQAATRHNRRLAPAETTQSQAPQNQMRTLTNRDGARAPMTARERALAAFWNQPTKK